VKQQGKEETRKPNPIKNRKGSNFIEGSKVEGKTWNFHQGRKSTSTLHFIFIFYSMKKLHLVIGIWVPRLFLLEMWPHVRMQSIMFRLAFIYGSSKALLIY
jgi:hypothetical protein